MSQRKISMFNGDSPQKHMKSSIYNKPKSKKRNEQDRDRDKRRRSSSNSSSNSSQSSSSRSSSSSKSDSQQDRRSKNRRQTKRDVQKTMQQRKSLYLQQEKLKELQQKEIQDKRKLMMIKSQKKIEMQEDVIEDLQNELHVQRQNVNQLNIQKEKLKEETAKIQTIEQEKNMVQSNFEAHKQKVQNIKRTIMKRQSTLMDIKADNFNKAMNKDQSRIREVGNTIIFIIQQIFFSLSNQYFLSKFVYRVANSSGAKGEVYFSMNAYLFNNYLFSLFIFLPFYIAFVLETDITSLDSLFLHNYDYSIHSYVSLSLAFFFLFQLIVGIYKYNDVKKKEVGQEAKKSKKIINFRIAFGDWNWKIRDRDSMKNNQFALTKRVKQYFSARDTHYLKYFDQNAGLLQKFFFRFIAFGLIIGSIAPIIVIHEKELFFSLIDVKFISEIINGLVVACISKIIVLLIIPLNKLEGLANQESRMKLLYAKKFFSEMVPVLASILMSYSVLLDDSSLRFYIGELNNDVALDITKYTCRESQAAYQLVGLLIGYFVVNIFYQYMPSFVNSIVKKSSSNIYDKQIQFDSIDASISLMVLNAIFLSLLPFTFFAIFLFLLILLINFFNEWYIQAKVTLPQYSGLSSTHVKGYVSFFYNITLLFCFCYYSFFYTRRFTPIFHTDNNSKLCNPFMGQNISLVNRLREYLYTTKYIGIIYDIVTWMPLVYALFVIYTVAYMVSLNQKKIWESEFQTKIKELSGIKLYYEERIGRLEKRIDDANKLLGDEQGDTIEQDDYNMANKTQNQNRRQQQKSTLKSIGFDERRGTDTSIHINSQSKIPKIGSLSSTNIPPSQSMKFINTHLTTEVKELDVSSKEDLSEELKIRRNLKSRTKNFF